MQNYLFWVIVYYYILHKQIMVCSRTALLTATNAPNMSTSQHEHMLIIETSAMLIIGHLSMAIIIYQYK